jgi:hypothetical protein
MSERVLKERCAQLERLLSAYLSHVSVSTSVPLRRFLGIVSPLGSPLTFDPDAGVCNITLVASDQGHQTIPRAIWNVAHAHAITSLNLNHNKLKDLNGLDRLSNLETLMLDNNELSLRDFNLPPCGRLNTLWLNNNKFDNIRDLVAVIAANAPMISFLSIMHNPATAPYYLKTVAHVCAPTPKLHTVYPH